MIRRVDRKVDMPGPFTWSMGSDTGLIIKKRTWRTQGKPYVQPLAFTFVEGREFHIWPGWANGFGAGSYIWHVGDMPAALKATANDRCSKKLYGMLGDQAQVSTALLERRQTLNMITARATQLLTGARQIRRGNFGAAAKTFGIKTPKGVSRKRQFSNNWLEFHFGWTPLIKDIGTAVDVLQSPPRPRMIQASASASDVWRSGTYPRMPPLGGQNEKNEMVYSVRSGVRFVISNPDLRLANQLGFTNPLSVAWEVVPFSFVVDWFIPVGDFLGAMTATLGLTMSDGYTSTKCYHQRTHQAMDLYGRGPNVHSGYGVSIRRDLGAISPYPSLQPRIGFSPTRALTAVTLLIQQLRK